MNIVLINQQNEQEYDLLLDLFTGIVTLFPGVVLLAILMVFYLLVKKGLIKILEIKFKKIGLIFNSLALLFALVAFYTCINWEFWQTLNTAIPLLIVSFLFNRSTQKLISTNKLTNVIYILIGLTILFIISSYLYYF